MASGNVKIVSLFAGDSLVIEGLSEPRPPFYTPVATPLIRFIESVSGLELLIDTVTIMGNQVATEQYVWDAIAGSMGITFAAIATSGSAADLISGTVPGSRLPLFSASTPGAVAASGGGTLNYLRADGQWALAISPGTMLAAKNLSDVASASTSRTNLGLAAIAASGSGANLGAGTVANAALANMPAAAIKGRDGGAGSGSPTDLTAAQVKAAIAIATSDVSGLAAVASSGSATSITSGTLSTARLAGVVLTANNLSDLASASAARANLGLMAIAASGSGADLGAGTVANSALANMTAATIKGRASGAGTGAPTDLTAVQVKTLLAISTSDISGLVSVAVSGSAADLTAGTLSNSRLSGVVLTANNLSEVTAATARTNLGLDTMATQSAGAVAITGGSITGMSTPVSGSDIATKSYVDNLSVSISWKNSVVAASTTNGNLATSFASGQTIDGVVLATGNRILLKNQTTDSENGIYVVAASGAPSRASDASTGANLISAAVFVQQGLTNADRAYVCTNDTIVIGSTSITFVDFSASVGALIATNNLSDLVSASTARTNLGLAAIAASGSGADLSAGTVANAALANMAAATIKGRASGAGSGAPVDLTAVQAKTLLAITTSDVSGLAAVATSGSATDITTGTLSNSRLSGVALTANNLSDLASASTARTNLGLAAIAASGSGADLSAGTVANAALASMAAATIKGRLFGGGQPGDQIGSDVKTVILALTSSDISGLAAVATSGSATDITTGTLNNARLSGVALTANNLSDLASASTARTNLGLATVASTGSAASLTAGTLAAARLPAFSGGDITSIAGSATLSLGANKATNSTLAQMPDATIKGRIFGGGQPGDLTGSDVKGFILALTSSDISGLAAVATSGSATDITTGTLSNSRLSGVALTANNLSDLASASTARTNLGLAAIATSGSMADIVDYMAATAPSVTVDPFGNAIYAATTTAGTLATSFANGQVIDGYTLVTGNYILIKNQANAAENGIYVVAASGAPTRHPSYNTGSAFVGLGIPTIIFGTVNGTKSFACVTPATITLGTTPLRFAAIPNANFRNNSYASDLRVRGVGVATIDPSNGYTQWFQKALWPSGTAGAPSVAFSSETSNDSGLFYTGTDNEVGWSSGGNEQLRVTASGLKMTTRVLHADGGNVASASSITLPAGNSATVTGSTTISNISGTNWTKGSRYCLNFASTCKVDGTGNVKFRSGTAFYSWGSGCSVDLEYDGSNWWVQSEVVMTYPQELMTLAAFRLGTAPGLLQHQYYDGALVTPTATNLAGQLYGGISTGVSGSGTQVQSNGDLGGVVKMASGTSSGGTATTYFPDFVPGSGTSKIGWIAARVKVATAINSQTSIGFGLMNYGGSVLKEAIVVSGTNSTANFMYDYDGFGIMADGTFGSMGVAIDTSWHTFEIWWLGDNKVHFAIDGVESGTGYTPATPTNALGNMLMYVTNGSTAANRELDWDWAMSVCGRL